MAHVVIADEDYGVLYLLAILISRLGWSSDMAVNGIAAWEKVQRQAPNLLIAELGLSGPNGLELLRAVKRNPPLARIPVVLMGSTGHEAAARVGGCAAYLTKSFGGQAGLTSLPLLVSGDTPD
jgi:CheY-like chemotaxis protein